MYPSGGKEGTGWILRLRWLKEKTFSYRVPNNLEFHICDSVISEAFGGGIGV